MRDAVQVELQLGHITWMPVPLSTHLADIHGVYKVEDRPCGRFPWKTSSSSFALLSEVSCHCGQVTHDLGALIVARTGASKD